MWNNFTAYFNRFYIAETAFEEGEEDIELNQKKPLFQFKEEKLNSQANRNFDIVIQYSSKILQFNKETKYVNKAIYMIAKSYYYKGQYNKSLRKFIELDGLKDEDYFLLAKLWIAKSELQMRNFAPALEKLSVVRKLAMERGDEDVLFQTYVSEISFLIYRDEFSKAVQKIEDLSKLDLEDDIKSEVTYELGMLYVSLGNYDKAVEAFKKVWEGEPTFEIEFKSNLEYAKAIKELEKNEEALDRLNTLRDDTKYQQYWDIVDLEIAQIELEEGRVEDALEIFYSIDTGYTKNESSGIASFMQGDIMEHIYMDYDSAKILYEKVATKQAPSEYKLEAKQKANVLKNREEFLDKIFNSKKGYAYLRDTTLFKQDSIAYAVYLHRRDSAMQVAEQLKEENGTTTKKKTSRGGRTTRGTSIALKNQFQYEEDSLFTYEPKMPLVSIDSTLNTITKNQYELGNLYFTDLIVPDSAYFYYNSTVTDYPNTKYQAKALYALGSYYLTLDKKDVADSLFRFVFENFNNDPISKVAAIRLGIDINDISTDPALEKYYNAENLIEENNYYDAIEELNTIYEEYPESQYSSKALYSIGWIYENKLSDYKYAVQFYDTLKAKYPKSDYVRDINSKLQFYHAEEKAVRDSIMRVEKAIADSIAAFQKAITDSIKADSLAQYNLLHPAAIVDSTMLKDSTAISDSTAIINSDSTKSSSNPNIETNTGEVLSDSAKAAKIFEEASKSQNKGKK